MKFDATSYEMGRQAGGGGGGSAVIESITITQNGTTTAPSGVDGYSPITVNVPAPTPTLQNKTVAANGTYTADQGYDGLGQVVVNVAGGQTQYDLTGNIDGVFASPQATDWFGANYAYINSISNITSMKATFQGVSAFPNKPITIASSGADCRNAFKDANLTALPAMSGKIIAADDMFNGANIPTVDLHTMTYDPDYTKDDYNSNWMFRGLTVDTIYMPAEFACYSFAYLFQGLNVKHIIDVFNSQENTIYTRKTPSPGWQGGTHYNIFESASYLRELPYYLVSALGNMPFDGDYACFYNSMCANCNDLDEIIGLPVVDLFGDGNDPFPSIVYSCNHLSQFLFDYDPNQVVNWNNFTLNFTENVGYGDWCHLGAAKEITDAASYAALKNDPDAWTKLEEYSRYNHNSVVGTINSLPQLDEGNTCCIVFNGNAGALTDAGAINTLTSSEIAVATAKGWTVSLQ